MVTMDGLDILELSALRLQAMKKLSKAFGSICHPPHGELFGFDTPAWLRTFLGLFHGEQLKGMQNYVESIGIYKML